MLVLQGRVHRFQEADARVRRAVHAAVALLGAVHDAQLQRVDAELLGDLVHDRFRERRVGGAGRPVGGSLRLVDHHVIAVHLHVRKAVRREDAHASGAYRRAGIGASLEVQRGLGGHHAAVAGGAHPDGDARARRRARALELLDAAHDQLDRLARLARQQRRHRLQVDGDLAAKAAADFGGHDGDARHRDAEHLGRLLLHHEGALRAGPDGDVAFLVPEGRGVVGLDVALVHGGGVELALDHQVGLLEAFRHVAQGEAVVAGDVALGVRLLAQRGGGQAVVQLRRVFPHGLGGRQHRRQHFVFHLDEAHRLLGDVHVDGRHRGDGVAAVQRFFLRQHVVAEELQVHRALAQVFDPVGRLWEVAVRHHRLDAGQRLRLAGIDRLDARVGVGTAQHLAVQHARQAHVGAVYGPAGHLVGAVRAHRPGTDHFISRCICHQALASMVSAASRTARTILSYPVQRHRLPASQ